MTDKLTTEDKQRIEQAAKLSWKNTITAFEDSDEISFWEGYLTGAEYATLYERQQQAELRNKVIEEAIGHLNSPLLNFSDGLIYKETVIDLLNSLKTK